MSHTQIVGLKSAYSVFVKLPNRDLRNYPSYLQTIKENLIEHYDVNDVRLPCGLCETHKRSLNYLKKSLNEEGVRNCQFDFARLSSYLKCGVKLRRKAQDCECLICCVARATGFNADHVLKKFLEEESENIGDTGAGSSNKPDRLYVGCVGSVSTHLGKAARVTSVIKQTF